MDKDYIVLVDKNNNVLGTAPKLKSHNADTPLHRAFSFFLFNSKGQLLLQQRAKKKLTFPLVWTNTCCGHPRLKEANIKAVERRLKDELGIEIKRVFEILPDFSYKAEMNGIVENELCPVYIGFSDQEPILNKNEVEDTKWIPWLKFVKQVKTNPLKYSVWATEETKQLFENKKFQKLYKKFTN